MKKRILSMMLTVVMIMSMAVLSGCGNSSEKKEDSKEEKTDEYKIGFSVSTLSNPFFVTMSDAADAKAKEMGIKIETLDAEDSSETQAQQVEDLILKEVDLMIINQVDSDAIGTSIMACNDADIPVITVSRMANSGEVVQHLDIDNYSAKYLL